MMRAARFPLHLPVRYRAMGQPEWRQATTRNISASGVLVEGADPLAVATELEFSLVLQGSQPAADSGQVAGRGRVVRIITAPESAVPGFAIAIADYQFLLPPVSDKAS
jgi:PilZ domain-containing protein